MKPNLALLSRVVSTPWAVRPQDLPVLAQAVLHAEDRRSVREGKTLKPLAGFVPLNGAALDAMELGVMPAVREDTTVILAWGMLGRGWTELEKYWLDAVEVDELTAAVQAVPEGGRVVIWFRSPGGIITGIPETAEALRKLGEKREVHAFTDDLCASAAYWLAAQCQKITATPTAEVGSIGVYVAFYDYCEYLKQQGISLELFRAGTMKGAGLPGHKLTPEEAGHIQAGVDEGYSLFTRDVLRIRQIEAATMQGQTMRGKHAKAANLVDAFAQSAAAFLK